MPLTIFSEVLVTTGISPKHIQFEITETAAVKHLQEAKRLISTLRSVGCPLHWMILAVGCHHLPIKRAAHRLPED